MERKVDLDEKTNHNNNNSQEKEDSHQQEESKKSDFRKKIIVFIPIGIPGMGKTKHIKMLTELFEQKDMSMTTISSDQIRKRIMDKKKEENPGITHQEAFDTTGKEAAKAYLEAIENALMKSKENNQHVHALFFDKNHPPCKLIRLIDFLHQIRFKEQFNIKIVVITPQCIQGYSSREGFYPFSLTFLVNCLQRVLARKEHETLVGDRSKKYWVVLGFFQMYKDFKVTDETIKEIKADLLVEFPFTHEESSLEEELNEKLHESLDKVLKTVKGFEVDMDKLLVFANEMETLNPKIKNPDEDLIYKKSAEILEKSLKLFK